MFQRGAGASGSGPTDPSQMTIAQYNQMFGNTVLSPEENIKWYGGKAIGEMQPYEKYGLGSLDKYQAGSNLMMDPQAFRQQMMQGYSMSPEAKMAEQEGLKMSTNQASAMGMSGGGALAREQQKYAQTLTQADASKYYQQQAGTFQKGMAGEGALGQIGMGASKDIAQSYMGIGSNIARMQGQQSASDAAGDAASDANEQQMAESAMMIAMMVAMA